MHGASRDGRGGGVETPSRIGEEGVLRIRVLGLSYRCEFTPECVSVVTAVL